MYNVNSEENVKFPAQVTVDVPQLATNHVNVRALHYNTAAKVWEVIPANKVDNPGKTATITLKFNASPVIIIAFDVNAPHLDLEDDGLFAGDWKCGGTKLSVQLRQGEYQVSLFPAEPADDTFYWCYTCVLDESGALVGTGVKINRKVIYENGGWIDTAEYTDGEATFTLDGETLTWNDAVENAGENMTFIRETKTDEEE